MTKPFRAATRSPVALARTAYRVAQAALPAYSSPFSRKDFTQAQLFSCLALMEFCKTDYRGIISYLADFSELRQALELKDKVPHYSTLCRAKERLGKMVPLNC
jgi:hypothetical protein